MTYVLSFLRSVTRPERVLRGCIGLALLAVAWACADKVVGPTVVVPKGQIGVYADLGPTGVTTLVIQVSGPGIVKQDNSPDTLAFNIPLTNGVASGSLDIPAGPSRVITARAFVGVTETHRGSVTTDILEGTNPTLHITLAPLVGNLPITISIGSTIVVVHPGVATIGVGDTVHLTSDIYDFNGSLLNAKVRWATLNPNKASVDTTGLVTVKDTGDVQIVGTYGTVGGSAKITGVFVASVSAIHLTWNGSVNNSWTTINNWTPHGLGAARVPALTDSVVIPAGAPNMPQLQCANNNAVRDIVIEPTASLGSICGYPLNVYGSAVIKGSAPNVYARPNAKLAGNFAQLYVEGAGVKLIDSVTATYVQVDIPTGTFTLDHHKLRSTGDLTITDGTITMVDGDTLIVTNNVNWSGDDQNGLLTGGVLFVRGGSFYAPRYYGSGTSKVVLDRTNGGTSLGGFDYVNSPNNSQIRRLEIKTRDGADICSYLRVTDTLSLVSTGTPATLSSCSSYRIMAQGPVITGTNTDVANYEWELMHPTGTSLVTGTWHPQITGFKVDDATINPALGYVNLQFTAKNKILANMAITGYVWMNTAAAELDLNGRKLTVGNYIETHNGATFKMMTAADSLIVGEYGYFPDNFHGAQKPKLTGGVITLGAYLYGFGFASAGTKLVMTGTSSSSSKYISGMNYENRPAQELYDLDYTGSTYGVCERIRVVHNVVVKAGATVNDASCGGGYLAVLGDLITEATSTLSPYLVALNTPVGTSHVAGAYAAQHTDFNVPNAIVKPGLSYGNMRFFASTQLSGTTTATGYVYTSGAGVDLAINGQKLFVGNYLHIDNTSTLTMNNPADSVTVANYGYFNANTSAAENGKLTAGVLIIGEYLYGFGFSASGTHKLVMAGTNTASGSKYISGMNFESRPSQGVQNLEIAAGKSYSVCERLAVKGTLTLANSSNFDSAACGGSYLRADGDIITASPSTLAPYNMMLNSAFGTDHVDGTFTPLYTSIHSSAVAGHLKAGLGYQHLQFYAPISLNDNLTVAGDLNVNGSATVLNLNGHQLTVNGAMNMQSNASIVMQNAADALDVSGNVSWNGGGSEAGKLTAGTATFRGDYFCATNYETSLTHMTVFDRSGSPVRVACLNSSSTSQLFTHVQVKGYGVALECHMNVAKDLQVFSGATVRANCGSTLYVGEDLITAAGSTITNGLSYPSSNNMAVVLGNATGTQHVLGSYDPHVTYFTALNSYIRPTLSGNGMEYRHVRIDQSVTFQDSTEFDGGLELINNAIVDLGGHTLVVRGSMDFNNTSRLKMTSPNDTLVVGYGDPSADLLWDGGDNLNDGTNPLLTNGAVKFYGDRFYGLKYNATVSGANHHRFIFMPGLGGSISLEASPGFANLEIRGTRPITNSGSSTLVRDSLIMGASSTYSGNSGYVQVLGDLVMASGADLSVQSVYLDGANGTSLVSGNFHPPTAYFRATSPAANAIKAGLAYQNVSIQTGLYSLNTSTSFAGNLGIANSGQLTLGGNTLTVGGGLDVGSGGGLVMAQSTDVVNVAGNFQINSGQAGTTLSGGTLNLSGDYNMFTDVSATGTHKVVMTGTGAKSMSTGASGNRALKNLDITGTGAINLTSGLVVNGSFRILAATAVSGGTSSIAGSLETVSGSSFTTSGLTLSDASGTSLVNGNLTVTGTITFATGVQAIKAGAGFSYANMAISSDATVTGALTVPGTLTINSGGTLTLPSNAVAALGTTNVSGTITFNGASTGTAQLTVFSGGRANAYGSTTQFADYGRIQVNSGGILDNLVGRNSGEGGFRYKLTGGISGYSNNGTLVAGSPTPIGQ